MTMYVMPPETLCCETLTEPATPFSIVVDNTRSGEDDVVRANSKQKAFSLSDLKMDMVLKYMTISRKKKRDTKSFYEKN